MKSVVNLTEGNIRKVLIRLTLPIIATTFMQMSYNLVNTLWIGRLGTNAVAAVGTAGLIINLGYAMNSLFIVGTTITISHCVGRKDYKEAQKFISTGLMLVILFAISYIAILIFFRHSIIEIFHIKDAYINAQAAKYLALFSISLFFSFANMLIGSIFYGLGTSKIPFKVNFIGVIINIILDPLLIFYAHMGIFGAAVSTIIANIIIFILFYYLLKKENSLKLIGKIDFSRVKTIMKYGFPMATQRILFTSVGIIIAIFVAKWGAAAIAAQKISMQIEAIAFMSLGGLNRATSTFVGQNYGAEKLERIQKGYRYGIELGIFIGMITMFIFLIFPHTIMQLFISDKNTIDIGANYLRILAVAEIFTSIEMVSNGSFTGIGKPLIPAVISIMFTIIRIPLALYLSSFAVFGLNGIWMSISLSMILKGIVSLGVVILIIYGIKDSRFSLKRQMSKKN